MAILGGESLSMVKMALGGAQKSNNFFTMILAKTQLIPLPINPISIIATNLPSRTISKIQFKDMGTTYNIAGDTTFGDWSITIRTYQFIDYRQIKSWCESIHAPMSGKRSLPKVYKTTCTLSQIDHKTGLPFTNFIIKGVYPVSISDIKYSEDTSDLITFDVTFNVDDVITL